MPDQKDAVRRGETELRALQISSQRVCLQPPAYPSFHTSGVSQLYFCPLIPCSFYAGSTVSQRHYAGTCPLRFTGCDADRSSHDSYVEGLRARNRALEEKLANQDGRDGISSSVISTRTYP